MTEQIPYVLGFGFDATQSHVAMIRKERPDWQKGLLNGIGGHIEEGETPRQAMSREFKEETGVEISEEGWDLVTRLSGDNFIVYVFMAIGCNLSEVRTMTDEKVVVLGMDHLWRESQLGRMVSNAMWLLSLCLDPDLHKFAPITVQYK
jgi:8-oxo-dGTP diphosphatase